MTREAGEKRAKRETGKRRVKREKRRIKTQGKGWYAGRAPRGAEKRG